MLCGSGWSFIHVPKCGGTTLRHYLKGKEAGDMMPLGRGCAVRSDWHRVLKKRPVGKIVSVVRHPASWLRSYWLDQSPERIQVERYLHQFWSDDLDQFVFNLCAHRPGYVSALYRACIRYHSVEVFRLEDGLDKVLDWLGIEHGEISVLNSSPAEPQLSARSLKLINRTERYALRAYGYAK